MNKKRSVGDPFFIFVSIYFINEPNKYFYFTLLQNKTQEDYSVNANIDKVLQ